ncbi:MAG: hypothetical protein OEY23_08140 [Acidimicrobiia bacterium]|nr:hypothetical protein [Acidimicrobiia bacterium]
MIGGGHLSRSRASVASALLALGLVVAGTGCGGSDGIATERVAAAPGEAEYRFVIPAGAGLAYDAGEPLEILPADLDVRVGEEIEIVNEDDRGHLVGPFFVGAGETLRQRFASEGEYEGECTVHPSGAITLRVRP